jgi:hypothetical protein
VAAVIAHVTGTALVPGVSRNGRLYTRENIAKAVARGQARIADGKRPISMRTHHGSGDDSTHIVGRVTRLWQDPDTGSAKYVAGIADTTHGRDIAALTDDSDGEPQFLRGVSIRGSWADEPRTETVDGRDVQTADDLEIAGLDYTAEPGVDDADVSHVRQPKESQDGKFPIIESAPDAMLTAPIIEAAQPLASGEPAAAPTKASRYADPGYQPDKAKRYALDTKAQAKSAWSYINVPKNAKLYTAAQLKRIKGRIKAALKKFGVEISSEEHWIVDRGYVAESAELVEHYGDEYRSGQGSFCVSLSNGPLNISVSSYCVDPADLDLIGRAAMGAACDALKAIDPDMDGDMDVPGADAEDTDGDMGEGDGGRMESAAAPTTPTEAVAETPASPVAEAAPEAPAVEAEGAQDPDAQPAPETEPAPETVADTNTEEEPVVTEPTTPAVENTPAATAPAVSGGVTLTNEQFQMLLAAVTPPAAAPVESAPAAPVAETPAAPVAPAPVAPAPAVPAPEAPQTTETQEQMIARMVREGITTGIQSLVENGGIKAQRKGLAGRPVTEASAEGLTNLGIPEDWPQKPLHTYTAEERAKYIDRMWGEHVLGESYYTGRR